MHGMCGDPVDDYETRRICSACAKEATETADATPADATPAARQALFAQAQEDKSKRDAELAQNKACEQEALTARPQAATRDLVTNHTKGEVHEAAELQHAIKMTQYDADIAAAPAAEQEDQLDGGIDFMTTARRRRGGREYNSHPL